MFHFTSGRSFRAEKVLGGAGFGDSDSGRILYAGPDPAGSDKVLIKKVFKSGRNQWFFEETFINGNHSVHSQSHSLGLLDLRQQLSDKERIILKTFRPTPNILSFSLYWRKLTSGGSHMSITEAGFDKIGAPFMEKFNDYLTRRDAFSYLKGRWNAN